MKKEVRHIKTELRFENDAEKQTIVGYAAVFNSPSHDLGGFIEYIRPGAFTDSLENNDVVALFNHDNNLLLGRKSSGTLRLKEDETGLAIEVDNPPTSLGNDIGILTSRGDLKGMSFGFCVVDENFSKDENGKTIREILKCDLFDISVVTNPAYEATEVDLRSFNRFKETNVVQLMLDLAKIGKQLCR